jgi:hypothetical protein
MSKYYFMRGGRRGPEHEVKAKTTTKVLQPISIDAKAEHGVGSVQSVNENVKALKFEPTQACHNEIFSISQ